MHEIGLIGISEKKKGLLKDLIVGGVKSSLSLFPPFSVAIGAWEGYQDGRKEHFINELSKRISKIEDEKIDRNFVKSEEFYDLFYKCCRLRLQHRSLKKAEFIVNLIGESISVGRDDRFNVSLKESFLDLIDLMSDIELTFLGKFERGDFPEKTRNDFYKETDKSQAIALDGLYKHGIIKDKDTWDKPIEASVLGREFLEYVKVLGVNGILTP